MNVYRQRPAVKMVGAVEKLLEKLRIQDTDKEVKAAVVVGDNDEQRRLCAL